MRAFSNPGYEANRPRDDDVVDEEIADPVFDPFTEHQRPKNTSETKEKEDKDGSDDDEKEDGSGVTTGEWPAQATCYFQPTFSNFLNMLGGYVNIFLTMRRKEGLVPPKSFQVVRLVGVLINYVFNQVVNTTSCVS